MFKCGERAILVCIAGARAFSCATIVSAATPLMAHVAKNELFGFSAGVFDRFQTTGHPETRASRFSGGHPPGQVPPAAFRCTVHWHCTLRTA